MKRWCTGYVLAAGLTVSGAVVGVPGHASAATTIYVGGPSATDAADCGAATAPCATIQDGYLKAHDNDTIKVAAGTYQINSQMAITKPGLRLEGAMYGVDARDRTPGGAGETIVTGPPTVAPQRAYIWLQADSQTLDGFDFEGNTGGAGATTSHLNSGYNVSHDIFDRNKTGFLAHSNGVIPSVFDENLYEDDNYGTAPGSPGTGVLAYENLANASFTNSRFEGNRSASVNISGGNYNAAWPTRTEHITIADNDMNGDAGIVLEMVPDAVVTGNEMRGGRYGVSVSVNSHRVDIERNVITDRPLGGIMLSSDYAHAPNTGITVANDVIEHDGTDPGRAGISVTHSRDVTIRNDLIVDSGRRGGIAFAGAGHGVPSEAATITQNTILRSGGPGISVAENGYTGPMEVRYNRIVDNEENHGLVNDSPGARIDARWNWWGCNHQPDGSSCDHPAGIVDTHVEFEPCLVLTIAAEPSGLLRVPHSIIRSTLFTDSYGEPRHGPFFHPMPVAFNSTIGTIEPTSETTDPDLRAHAFWHAGQGGSGQICNRADHQVLCLLMEVTPEGPEIEPPAGPGVPPGQVAPGRPVRPGLVRPGRPVVRVTG